MTCSAGWIICGAPALSPTSVSPRRSHVVEERRHQNGLWPLNVLHQDLIPVGIEMETEVGTASRWNTLRALRVLDWCSELG